MSNATVPSLQMRALAELELRNRSSGIIDPEKPNPTFTFQNKYRDDPVGFVADCFDWKPGEKGAAPYQNEIMQSLVEKRRVSARGPHGLGKTALLAWVVLWFALTNDGVTDWKIPITASAWRQLTKFAWPEIHKWARRLKWYIVGREPFNERYELTQQSLKLSTGEAFALSSDNPAMIEGAHATRMLYMFDESKEIQEATWDSAEGAFSSGDCYWLAVSTPGEPIGRFYSIQSRKPGYEDWFVRHVSLEEAIAAGRMNIIWVEARRKQWGENSAVFQNRVKGEFASSEADGVIPLSWIEKANERWNIWHDQEEKPELYFIGVGADIARSGEDQSVLALRFQDPNAQKYIIDEKKPDKKITLDIVTELRAHHLEDTMQTTGRILGIVRLHGEKAIVDVIGIGAGVVDRLREIKKESKTTGENLKYEVIPFNASEHTDYKDSSGEMEFINCRSAAWWHMREILDPDSDMYVALPPDDSLTGDLVSPHWKMTSGGKVQVEAKEDIKARLERSTDHGDAVVMVFFDNNFLTMQNWTEALKKRTQGRK
jgi:hypothetical protein